MSELTILCWNVDGIRAVVKRGFFDFLEKESPDVLCLQETKARPDDLTESLVKPGGYFTYWNYPAKKGWAGVATFSKEKPLSVQMGFGKPELDIEGRTILSEHAGFSLYNIYFPNGKKDATRLKFKLDFYDAFLAHIDKRKKKGDKLIICGDINTAHKEIDIARPKSNEKISGFLPVERAWMDKLVDHGFIDTFRYFHKEPEQYTWWDYKTGARERNVGWRLDYFFVSENLIKQVREAYILKEITGSDHCPVGLLLKMR